jgi:hypothetical protein
MSRILLDDSGHVGTSTQIYLGSGVDTHDGDNAKLVGTKLKQWGADVNTMTGEIYAPLAITAAEIAAGVTPVNYGYPPMYADRYGANTVPGTTDRTVPIQNALAVATVYGGTAHFSGKNKITAGLVIPAGVVLQGDGGASGNATTLEHWITATNSVAVTLGTSDTGLSYYPGLRDVSVNMHVANTTGILLRSTCGADLENVMVNGDGVIFTYTGVIIQGGTGGFSNFFNVLKNVYCAHIHKGFQFTDAGTFSTISTFINCSAFGDVASDPTSIGVEFIDNGNGPNGLNSVFIGGNIEDCGTGVKFANNTQGTSWFGQRFEANGVDIDWGNNTVTGLNTFFGYGHSYTTTGSRFDNGIIYGQNFNNIYISSGLNYVPRNIAIGLSALGAVTGGSGANVAVGQEALLGLLTATQNTAIGDSALKATTANNNTAVGTGALIVDTTGAQNTAVGAGAGSSMTTGADCTAVGYNAQSGSTGNNNLALGYNAGTASSPHTIAAAESNRIVIGDSNISNMYSQVDLTVVSDERDKRDIKILTL